MADITTVEDRTVRLSIIDGLIHIGFYLGNAFTGKIKAKLGLQYNFALGMLVAIIAAAYTLIFVKESKQIETRAPEEYPLDENTTDQKGNIYLIYIYIYIYIYNSLWG